MKPETCEHGVKMSFLFCRECSIVWHEEGKREAQERVEHHQRCLTALATGKGTEP